ncbi:hypothetical protein CYMTET_40448 [Cymbomonas tetramitiformis]|uniref:procollagen-proline 4-dioxygenase n=1 Tax=Cymbomonas tetramitiformis TaxID=36881 RepID=A0AAE0F3I1_9CHLO|nr:hypothetical protein CYMTET_40448 [Cymbomonas tetramitiformis]
MKVLFGLFAFFLRVQSPAAGAEERLIGWKGEVPREQFFFEENNDEAQTTLSKYKEEVSADVSSEDTLEYTESGFEPGSQEDPDSWFEQISWKPRAYIWHKLLTKEECNAIVKLASPRIAKSKVVDSKTGQAADDPIRTSWGTYLTEDDSEVVRTVNEKVAKFSMLPASHGEQLQVLRYTDGQKYDAHWDQFDNPVVHKALFDNGGQRVATVLLYLSNVEQGGETVFPESQNWIDPAKATAESWSSCGGQRGSLAVKPRKGDALLFWGTDLTGKTDKTSKHAGCPVIRGVKWTATKWLHALPYDQGTRAQRLRPGECKDLNDMCPAWAKQGECEKNPTFMRGTTRNGLDGQCSMSCNACSAKMGSGSHADVVRGESKHTTDGISKGKVRGFDWGEM